MRSDQQNSRKERELKSNLDEIRRKRDSTRRRLKSNRENATTYSIKLDEIENSKEASALLKDINERIKTLKDRKGKVEDHINESYTIKLLDEMWILCGYSTVFEEFQEKVSEFSRERRKLEREDYIKRGKKELAKEISNGIIPLSPNVPDKISMKEMIKDEVCKVCGRKAEEGSDAYKFMVNKLNELIKSQQPEEKKKEEQVFPNNYLKELEQKSNNLEYNQDKINNLIKTIKEVIEFNVTRKAEASELQESIDGEEEKKKKLLAQMTVLLKNNFKMLMRI
jgi:DNA sulfur modification protein DndD